MAESVQSSPTCIIVLGMAGCGKTSFVNALGKHLQSTGNSPYIINLDPACLKVPYAANIDIRDSIKYKNVMREYALGPNGAIVTCLNLYATKFGDVISLINKNRNKHKYFIFDTPGQIEVFTWSASGNIITESLASSFTTIIVYVLDTAKCTSPVTFMSNMLYSCSILYKTKLPFIVAMNKIDIVENRFAIEWMRDFDAYNDALESETSYISNLSRSMALVLDEFYENLLAVGVSSITGENMDKLLNLVSGAEVEFNTTYKVEWEAMKIQKLDEIKKKEEERLTALKKSPGLGQNIELTTSTAELDYNAMYLKPTGDDSSSDSEGEEQAPPGDKEFEDFVSSHRKQLPKNSEEL